MFFNRFALFLLFFHTTFGQLLCPKGWIYVKPSCWKYHPDAMSWPEARFECQSNGAELASIHTEEENRLMTTLIDKFQRKRAHHHSIRRKQSQVVRDTAETPDLSCFDKHPSSTLVGFAEVVVSSSNVNACLTECLSAQGSYNIQCHSVLYFSDTHDCILNTESRSTKPDLFTTDTSGIIVDYYDNNCNTQVTPVPGNCFQLYPNKALIGYAEHVITGINGLQCQEECTQAISKFSFDCRSIVYYKTEQSCILNKESRITKPDLFAMEQSADYYEKLATCNTTPTPSNCPNNVMDLFLVVDSSNSIGPQSFENIRMFLKNLVGTFNIGPNSTYTGLLQFNEEPRTEFHLKSYQTTAEVLAAIDAMKWMGGHTLIGKALKYVLDYELIGSQGDRTPNIPDVVIVLTDGLSQDNPVQAAQQMRSNGILVYAIGVTEAVLDEQLMTIAGSTDRVYKVTDFTRLDSRLRDQILRDICNPPKPVPPPIVNPCNICPPSIIGYPSPVYQGYPTPPPPVYQPYPPPPVYQRYPTPLVYNGYPTTPLPGTYPTPQVTQTYPTPPVPQTYPTPQVLQTYSTYPVSQVYQTPGFARSIQNFSPGPPGVAAPSSGAPAAKSAILADHNAELPGENIPEQERLEVAVPQLAPPPSPFAFSIDNSSANKAAAPQKESVSSPDGVQPPRGVWIGITDQFSESHFVWVDNTPVNYTNWKFAQPDGDTQENCVLSLYEPLQRWIDTVCSLKNPFICKRQPKKVLIS